MNETRLLKFVVAAACVVQITAGAAGVLLGRLFEMTSAGVSSRPSQSSRIPGYGCSPDGNPSLTQFVNHQPRRLTTIGFNVGGVSRPMV
jgi:hypothetical protein